MSRRAIVAVLVLLCGCATTAPQGPEVVTRAQPGLESTPTRARAGLPTLPAGLEVDPRTLRAKPLELTIRAPERFELPNGLTVYLVEDHTTPLVLLRALLPFGTADEPADKLGLASLTARLLTSGGAGALGPEAFDALLERHAVDASSGAGDEYSQVAFSVRSQDLARLFPAFADVLRTPRFDAERLTVARGQMLESVRRRDDDPSSVASRALSKAVFGPTHPLAREPLASHLTGLTRADVTRFFAAHQTPRGARLVVTGDFDAAALRALIELHLGAWSGKPPVARTWPSSPPLERRVVFVPREVAQVKIRVGALGFRRATAAEYPLRLVGTTLGGFGVGRLYREVRDARGLAYAAWAQVNPGPTTGLFVAGVDTRPTQVVDALKVALGVLEQVGGAQPVTQAELSTAVEMSLNAFAFRFDTPARVGLERALFDLLGYPPDFLETFRAHMAAVTLDEANAAAAALGRQPQIVVVGPRSLEAALSAFGPVQVVEDVDAFR